MNITTKLDGKTLEIALEGRLDTSTAPDLDKELKTFKEPFDALVFDFEKLEYISSAGLRVLLSANKMLTSSITIKNANDIVKEVFEVTGFDSILNIE